MSEKPEKCRCCGNALLLITDSGDARCRTCGEYYLDRQNQAEVTEIGKHYGYDYRGVRLDPYRIFSVYRISHPAQQHAIKKLLRAGESVKSLDDDIAEAIATLQRWQQMRAEDET